jgi:hypothetical protein
VSITNVPTEEPLYLVASVCDSGTEVKFPMLVQLPDALALDPGPEI